MIVRSTIITNRFNGKYDFWLDLDETIQHTLRKQETRKMKGTGDSCLSFFVSNVLTATPKSGDVELHIAPMLAVASIASTAKLELGKYPTKRQCSNQLMGGAIVMGVVSPTTRSPSPTPAFFNECARRFTLCLKLPYVI